MAPFHGHHRVAGALYHFLNPLGLGFPISKRVGNFVLSLRHLEHLGRAETGPAIPASIPMMIFKKTPPLRLKLWLHPCLYFPCKGPDQLQVAGFSVGQPPSGVFLKLTHIPGSSVFPTPPGKGRMPGAQAWK